MSVSSPNPSGQIFVSPVITPGSFSYEGGSTTQAVSADGGTVTLNGATPVTVADANVTANSIIVFTLKTVGGTVRAQPVIETITPGTGFTVQGTAGDTSVYNFMRLG